MFNKRRSEIQIINDILCNNISLYVLKCVDSINISIWPIQCKKFNNKN